MYKPVRTLILILLIIPNFSAAEESSKMDAPIDQRSFRLGSFSSFAEMVSVDVKSLALSAALSPDEMDALVEEAAQIAGTQGVMIYREPDLIVTDLFPADVALEKHVLLIYKGNILDRYLALKQEKTILMNSGAYEGAARKDIARQFGKLLSYPDAIIEEKIK
ncbi:MAG: thioredoxin-related protein [Gammaproteobacteria bacterium]